MEGKPPERNLLRYATVGIEFLVVFLLLLFLGWQVDRWIGFTRPGATILGGIVGFAAAFYRITKQGWGILQDGGEDEDGDQGGDADASG